MNDVNVRMVLAAIACANEKEIRGKRNNGAIVRWIRRAIPSFKGGDETAWCSAFLLHVADVACANIFDGDQVPNALARSWQTVGSPVSMAQARPGDVAVMRRPGGKSWQGHVALYCRHRAAHITLLGGNQRNRVGFSDYKLADMLALRRLASLPRITTA